MTSSDGSRTTNSSRLSQFGIYKSIDARTEEFLRLSRKRQLRQGCACAALTTAITVTIVVTGLLVYEYTTTLDEKSHQEPGRSNWRGLFNTSSAFNPMYNKAKIIVDPTTLKLLPLLLKALNHNRYLEKFLEDYDSKKLKYPPVSKHTTEYSFLKRLLPTAKMRTTPNIHVKYNYPLLKSSINNQNLEAFRKNKHSKHQESVLKYFNKMIDGNTYKGIPSLSEKENTKSPFFEYPMEIVDKRNSTTIRESKVYTLNNKTLKKESEMKEIPKTTETNKSLLLLKNSIAITTLQKPPSNSNIVHDFTQSEQVIKSETNKIKDQNCTCTKNLLLLINKLMVNIRDLIPEIVMYEKRCRDAARIDIIKTTTMLPVPLSITKPTVLSTEPTTTIKYTSTATVPTTTFKYSTVTVPMTTIKYTTQYHLPKALFQDENLKTNKLMYFDREILREFSKEPIVRKNINKGITVMHDIESTTTKRSIEPTYSCSDIPTTVTTPMKPPVRLWAKPVYPTKTSRILKILNDFKRKLDADLGSEYEQENMDLNKIINNNRNIEPKLLPGVEIVNPQTLEGYNKMKFKEEDFDTENVNNFKSIMCKEDDDLTRKTVNNSEYKRDLSVNENDPRYLQNMFSGKTSKNCTTKSIINNSKSKQNNIDEVFKSYAEVNALISKTQNISDASIYELYKKKEDDNSTAVDYDEAIDAIETEQIQTSEPRRHRKTYDKYDTIKQTPTNAEVKPVRSMLPFSRPSYLEIHRSVPKQDILDYDNTESYNNNIYNKQLLLLY